LEVEVAAVQITAAVVAQVVLELVQVIQSQIVQIML
jgi:hypothetical protein